MKPTTPRRRRQQAQQQPQQPAAASFGSSGGMSMTAFVIRAGRTKHGARRRGRLEYAQKAINALYPTALPAHVNHVKLTKKVNEQLKRNPEFKATGYEDLSRQTVMRALATLRAANS